MSEDTFINAERPTDDEIASAIQTLTTLCRYMDDHFQGTMYILNADTGESRSYHIDVHDAKLCSQHHPIIFEDLSKTKH